MRQQNPSEHKNGIFQRKRRESRSTIITVRAQKFIQETVETVVRSATLKEWGGRGGTCIHSCLHLADI